MTHSSNWNYTTLKQRGGYDERSKTICDRLCLCTKRQCEEPCEGRLSRTVLCEGETPSLYSTPTLTQIKNMKFPGVTNKTIMEVVNNYGLFTEKYDKVIYSAIDFISKGSYIQIQSDCNRIAIGLQSDSFPTHTRDDKDIKIKIKDHHIDAVDDDNSTEMASLEPPSEDMPEEDNSSDVADMEASEKEGACILDIPINSSWSEILMMKS